jgi:hypothetical protein
VPDRIPAGEPESLGEAHAAGVRLRREQSAALTAEIVRLYRSGLTLGEVGQIVGLRANATLKRLIAAGEPRRPRGRPKTKQ